MTEPDYRRAYPDSRLNDAYRIYVDGGSQRKVAEITGIPSRTIARHSKRDGWTAEKEERSKARAGSVVAAIAASAAASVAVPEVSEALAIAAKAPDVQAAVTAVLKKHQWFTGTLYDALADALARTIEGAKAAGKPITASMMFPFVALGEKVLAMHRKANGIPDITSMEIKHGGGIDVRHKSDDELSRELAAEERIAADAAARAKSAQSVN